MKIIFIVGIQVAAAVAWAQTTFTPISSLNQPSGPYYSAVDASQSVGVAFTTGSAATSLASVSVKLGGADLGTGGGTLGTFSLALYSDAGGLPGSSVATLSGNAAPPYAGVYTFTNASPVVLGATTTYWVVASTSGGTGSGSFYRWSSSAGATFDAGSIWTGGGAAETQGGVWYSGSGPTLFSVTVARPEPPAVSLFQPLVLTYPATGFPFVLQQNADLNTTNWVTVTNAIQLNPANTNQVVFLVPSAGQRLFYRLSLP